MPIESDRSSVTEERNIYSPSADSGHPGHPEDAMQSESRRASRLQRLQRKIQEHPNHRRWLLWTCLAGGFATTFTITILGVSLKAIADDLGSQVSTIAWVMTAPMLVQAVSAPILGKMGDLHGHRRVYLIGFTLATIVAVATAFAWDAASLIGLRALGQLAGTATMPASMAMLFRAYDGPDRVKAMGWMSVVFAGGPVLGLAIGGVMVESFGWRPIFLLQAVLSALACLVALIVLVETPRRQKVSLDVKGALALALGAFAITFAINRVPSWGIMDPRVALAFALTPVFLIAFVRIERSAPHPLIPLEFLTRRNFALPLIIGFSLQFAYMGGFIVSPLIMLGVFGFGQAVTSMWIVARPISFAASSPVGGHLGSLYGERAMVRIGSVLIFLAMLAFTAGAAYESIWMILMGLVFAGLGMGFAQPSLSTIVASAVTEEDHGIAVSTMSTTSGIGAVAGISILTALCADATTAEAFRNGYGFGAAVAAVGVLVSFGLRKVVYETPVQKASELVEKTGALDDDALASIA